MATSVACRPSALAKPRTPPAAPGLASTKAWARARSTSCRGRLGRPSSSWERAAASGPSAREPEARRRRAARGGASAPPALAALHSSAAAASPSGSAGPFAASARAAASASSDSGPEAGESSSSRAWERSARGSSLACKIARKPFDRATVGASGCASAARSARARRLSLPHQASPLAASPGQNSGEASASAVGPSSAGASAGASEGAGAPAPALASCSFLAFLDFLDFLPEAKSGRLQPFTGSLRGGVAVGVEGSCWEASGLSSLAFSSVSSPTVGFSPKSIALRLAFLTSGFGDSWVSCGCSVSIGAGASSGAALPPTAEAAELASVEGEALEDEAVPVAAAGTPKKSAFKSALLGISCVAFWDFATGLTGKAAATFEESASWPSNH
mmetsp:Transcript_60868/g.177919  ORF Transcript_60868/g.177919 Transcript_60868/m.177919 type:complete len:388 (+) Transcript_60868:731-1894(+)